MKKYLLFSSVLLFGLSCAAQDKNINSLLWRISNDRTERVSYLFGTIHLPQKKFVVYSDSVYAAIQNIRVFYNEVDFLNHSLFTDPELLKFFEEKEEYLDSLKDTPGWKNLIARVNRHYNVNLASDNLQEFIEFSQKIMSSYFETEEGVAIPDMMLAQHAKLLGKETGGLETPLMQFKLLYDLIDARIADTTLQFEDETDLIVTMKKFYLDENIDSITSMVENINASYRQLAFDKRNKTMTDSIEKHMLNESSFFAIGVGHLGGEAGVIELLRKKGFTLTPVHSNNKISILIVNNMIRLSGEHKNKFDDDVKINGLTENPPPPPPKDPPPKVKMVPVKKKNN